jgi:two-component system response regulator HydG
VPRILLVDDELAVLQTIKMILDLTGHEVLTASSAAEAIQVAKTEPIDLLLTDLRLGAERGTDVIAAARQVRPELPIIAMSGDPTKDDMLAVALRLGARQVLQKPIKRTVLVQVIDRCLQARP